jgi:hypothetical protein
MTEIIGLVFPWVGGKLQALKVKDEVRSGSLAPPGSLTGYVTPSHMGIVS